MTKSTITREQLLEIIETDHVQCGEASYLARMALAAMDSSESVELPLDYLQGHKDGLEWAAQLAEANHPETGDWLYDDPIELAKAIRKGPDMPPAQPVEDSEPDCNERQLFCSTDTARMKKVISVSAGSEATPLYRHAQPVPVVSADLLHTAASAIEDLLTTKDRMGVYVCFDLPFRLRSAANAQPAPAAPVCTCPSGDGSLRWPCPVHPGNSPVIPDGWTCNDKANAALMMLDRIETVDPVDDDRIDGIKRIVRELAAAPHDTPALNSVQSVDSVADRWIPVSERMPEDRTQVILWDAEIGEVTSGHYSHKTQTFYHCGDAIENEITHWMPLPAGPQEVK
ncbi:TPA: DUF551 domain-containing protein [Klebsiella pneumoniae]|uniref:DUF551 domain-containing protein n=4 Tax=Klebsiella TaxID=570 RepID=UPI0029E8206D|nr:DUF551 domain-containing protein [Klebsiella pneumoniae]MDZ6343723.1 DUF551 domain-containing protein [Klebsiella pneumoniae]